MIVVLTALGDAELGDFGVESPAYVAIRAVQFAAMLAVVGALMFRLIVVPAALRQSTNSPVLVADLLRRVDRLAFRGMVALGIVSLARFVAQHAAMFGTGATWARTTIDALLMQSTWGHGWMLGVAGGGVGALAARHVEATVGKAMLIVATGALTVSLSLSGHPAAAPQPALAIAVDALHVLGAGAWVGGVACLAMIAIPLAMRDADNTGHRLLAHVVSAFGPVAIGGAILVALTGGLAGWRNVGSIDALFTSPYGLRLLTKIGAVAVAAAIGAYNSRRIGPKLGDAAATARLRRVIALEFAAMVVVIVVTAVLVASPFPGEGDGS